MTASVRIQRLTERAAEMPHGTRSRYNTGCHCDDCRRANREYEAGRTKRRIFHGARRVPADRVIAHTAELRAAGMGRRAIAAAADYNCGNLHGILMGRRKWIDADAEARILAVTPADAADRSYIRADRTLELIAELVDRGYTKKQLAEWLGYKWPALQYYSDRITKRNADAFEALYHRLNAGLIRRSE